MPKTTTKFVPNYQKIIDDIRGRIQNGTLTDGSQLPSEREMGLHYKVSRQTIRTAVTTLASGGWIESCPGKGNFVRTKEAQTEKVRIPTRQIGVICRNSLLLNELGLANLLWGLNSAFSSHGYTCAISVDAADRAHKLEPMFPDWIKSDAMDGYVLVSTKPRIQHQFAALRTPVVALGYLWAGDADIPSVSMDFRAIYGRCLEFLARENCLPLCNLVMEGRNTESAFFAGEILSGHRDGMKRAGLSSSQAHVVRYAETPYGLAMGIQRAMKHKPRTLILESARHLDVVIDCLNGAGHRVPEDILVVTILSHAYPSVHHFRTATLKFPPFQMAMLAGRKLHDIIESKAVEPRNELLDIGEFVLPAALQPNANTAFAV